jgi:hypothetical protein
MLAQLITQAEYKEFCAETTSRKAAAPRSANRGRRTATWCRRGNGIPSRRARTQDGIARGAA